MHICKIDRIDRGRDPNQHGSDEMLPQPLGEGVVVAWEMGIGNWELGELGGLGEGGGREQRAMELPGS